MRRFGAWMCDEANNRIGRLYSPIEITTEIAKDRPDLSSLIGKKLTVLAWIWARTVKSPNPAFSRVDVPLASTFVLANKEGKETYIQPVITGDQICFTVKAGKPPKGAAIGTKASAQGANFRCLLSGTPISADYIRQEAQAGRMGQRLMAVVVQGHRRRIYLPPTRGGEEVARSESPIWAPDIEFFQQALGFRVGNYG